MIYLVCCPPKKDIQACEAKGSYSFFWRCRWRLIGKRKQGRASAILFVDQCPVGRNGRRVSKSTRWIRRLVGHLSDKRLCQRHKLPTYTLEGVKIREQLSFHYITNTKRCSSGVKSTLDSSHDDDSAYEYEYTICLPLKYEESSSFLPSVKAMGRENVGRLPNDHGSKIICPSWFSADEKCKLSWTYDRTFENAADWQKDGPP